MIVRISQGNKKIYYDNVVKATHNMGRKTILLEIKKLFKNRFVLYYGIDCNDYEVLND